MLVEQSTNNRLTAEEEWSLTHAYRRGLTARASLDAEPILNRCQAFQLVQAVCCGLAARDRLLNCNLALVKSVAAQFAAPDLSFDELEQEGRIQLLTIIDRFEPDRQLRFSTYARPVLQGRLQYYIKQERKRATLSLDKPSSITGLTLGETMEGPAEDPYRTLELTSDFPDLHSVVNMLPEPNRQIVLAYYGFSGSEPISLRHVQQVLKLDMSHETIRKTLKHSLQMLREILGVTMEQEQS